MTLCMQNSHEYLKKLVWMSTLACNVLINDQVLQPLVSSLYCHAGQNIAVQGNLCLENLRHDQLMMKTISMKWTMMVCTWKCFCWQFCKKRQTWQESLQNCPLPSAPSTWEILWGKQGWSLERNITLQCCTSISISFAKNENIWESDDHGHHQSSEGEEWRPRVLCRNSLESQCGEWGPFTHRPSIVWNYFTFLIVWNYFRILIVWNYFTPLIFKATLLNPNVENEGHSHTGPRYFETISGSG